MVDEFSLLYLNTIKKSIRYMLWSMTYVFLYCIMIFCFWKNEFGLLPTVFLFKIYFMKCLEYHIFELFLLPMKYLLIFDTTNCNYWYDCRLAGLKHSKDLDLEMFFWIPSWSFQSWLSTSRGEYLKIFIEVPKAKWRYLILLYNSCSVTCSNIM